MTRCIMNETLECIQKVSNERQNLWRKAGQGGLSTSEINRVEAIAEELSNLWDTYRRELAGFSRQKQVRRNDAA